MILCGGEGQYGLSVGEDEKARLFAEQAFLNNDFGSGAAKTALETLINCRIGFLAGLGDGDPFSCCQAICLDDDRQRMAFDIGFGMSRIVEAGIVGSGNIVFAAEILGETF